MTEEPTIYRVTVVVRRRDKEGKMTTKDFHVDLNMRKSFADAYQQQVAKKGFTALGERYFPDEIESLTLYEVEDE